jgi:3-oxoacyl-[acyl-carrier-protein] synthase-3
MSSAPETFIASPQVARAPGGAFVAGLGAALPDTVVANDSIAASIGVDGEWIERRTGIRRRRWAAPELTLAELSTRAGRAALADAGLDAERLDLVILATVSQESSMPNVAPKVAAALGATRAGAFDLGAACAGFVMGLAMAASYIEAGRARHVLVVAADMLSRQTDPGDRRTAALFGDGAGAIVVGASEPGTIGAIELGSDGLASELIRTDPASGLIEMNGHDTFKEAVRRMSEATQAVCASAGVDLLDVDLFVFHQANARITRALGEKLELPPERVVDNIAELGNTSAASIPLALEQARDDGRLQAGSRVLICAVGSGFIWGAALLEWGKA